MASIQVFQYMVANLDDGRVIKAGSLSEARSVSISDGEAIDRVFKIAPETAVKVFDATEDEALGGFDFMWLDTDLDVLVQYTANAGVGDVYFVVELKGSGVAGTAGPAMALSSNVAHKLDGSVDTFDGTEDTIDEVWVYNEDSTETARVRVIAVT